MKIIINIAICFILTGCAGLNLKPSDYLYIVTKAPLADKVLPCFYNNVQDLTTGKNLRCVELDTLIGWILIHPQKLKDGQNKFLDQLIYIQQQNVPK